MSRGTEDLGRLFQILLKILMALKNHIGKCNKIYRWAALKTTPFKVLSLLSSHKKMINIDMITYTEESRMMLTAGISIAWWQFGWHMIY